MCGFEVSEREPETDYLIRIGDRGREPCRGAGRGRAAVWDDDRHFDGARGRVLVWVESRLAEGRWRRRARVPVYVRSSKLTAERYESMTEQMRGLASGLLLDLVSPMLRSLGMTGESGGEAISSRSGLEELRMLERLWAAISRQILEIELNPTSRLARTTTRRKSWGDDRLGAQALARLVANGIDPRSPAAPRPLAIVDQRLGESTDTREHRAIAGLLRFAQRRAVSCGRDVLSHRRAIEADRIHRDRRDGDGPTPYETEDKPRIAALDEALGRAERLRRAIGQARELPLFRHLAPALELPVTPVFEHVRPYREIRDRFSRYFRSSLLILDGGEQERAKPTHRLYEQWVFFQIASAFRAAGLACVSREGLFHRSHRYRYTLDVDRGAKLTFVAADNRAVTLRYEPWILPKDAAIQRRDSVYRGGTREVAWSPDVLIEFLSGSAAGRGAGSVDYAVVVDAKYTGAIGDHHWDGVRKYLDIRATRGMKQIVKQVWLAHPDPSGSFQFSDDSLQWPAAMDELPADESVLGKFGLSPPTNVGRSTLEERRGWIPNPEAAAREFVDRLLRHRRFPSRQTPLPLGVGGVV